MAFVVSISEMTASALLLVDRENCDPTDGISGIAVDDEGIVCPVKLNIVGTAHLCRRFVFKL